MQKKFEDWFEANFPKENFGSLSGVFREGIKNDVARKAFVEGLKIGLSTNFDTELFVDLENFLNDRN